MLELPRPLALVVLLSALALVLTSCSRAPASPPLLVTLGPATADGVPRGVEPGGTTLMRVDVGAARRAPQPLVDGFLTIETPRVSYDGRRALFAGRRSAGDPMQIWEVSLSGSAPQLLVMSGDSRDPSYLPDGRVVYARAQTGLSADAAMALYTANADGSGEQRITFGDARDRSPAVLADGRIVFRRHPVSGPGKLFAVNPDGTGIQIFCEPAAGASIDGGPWLIEDRVVFAELVPGAGERLVSASVHQPFGERQMLAGDGGNAGANAVWYSSVSALPQGGLVASAYMKEKGWSVRQLASSSTVPTGSFPLESSLPGSHASLRPLGLTLAAPRAKPLNLTTVVDETKRTGTLLCLDAHNSQVPAVRALQPGGIRAVRVLAVDGTPLGEAPVEADGSFFLEVPADEPLQLELLGPDGALVKDHGGLWVRPNENRGCIGCHEDPELAPENRVPLAMARAATSIGASRTMASLEGPPK